MSTVKGKCSICGGCVMEASPAYCSNCGAREAGPADRVIEMVPQRTAPPLYVPYVQPSPWPYGPFEIICNDAGAEAPTSTLTEIAWGTQLLGSVEQTC